MSELDKAIQTIVTRAEIRSKRVVRWRVALYACTFHWPVLAEDEDDARIVEESEQFVRWLTDWQEATP